MLDKLKVFYLLSIVHDICRAQFALFDEEEELVLWRSIESGVSSAICDITVELDTFKGV